MQTTEGTGYRADIDGLRGVAVALVVAFHLQTVMSHGGFIGVDIFFVISGFLITSILIRDLDRSRYSMTTFYVRRVRRIAPALIAVLTFTSIGAYFVLLPQELIRYAHSLLASIFFASNFYQWIHSGYFDAQSASNPLLHTWSLAVEEQFYIVFPPLMYLLHRYARAKMAWILAGLALLSFGISAWSAYRSADFAFYFPVSRAWELLVGSLLAMAPAPQIQRKAVKDGAAILGVLLIGFAIFKYHYYTPFPGVAALAPCLGAALIIGTGGETFIGRLLSWRPLVWLGMISYSLYLWHWPLIVFESMGISVGVQGRVPRQVVLFAISVAISALSWRFIEQPFRGRRWAVPARTVFVRAAWATMVPGAIAVLFLAMNGLPGRFSATAVRVASYLDLAHSDVDSRYRTGKCFLTSGNTLNNLDRETCLREVSGESNVLVFGDSHAAHLNYGLTRVFPGENFLQATAASCAPIEMNSLRKMQPPAECAALVNFVLHNYLPKSHIDMVILGGHWSERDLGGLGSTIEAFRRQGVTPILMGPAIEYDAALPRLLAFSIQRADPLFAQRHRLQATHDLDLKMAKLATDTWHVKYFSYFDALCGRGACQEYAGPGIPVEEDQAHLTGAGSLLVAQKLKDEQFLR